MTLMMKIVAYNEKNLSAFSDILPSEMINDFHHNIINHFINDLMSLNDKSNKC